MDHGTIIGIVAVVLTIAILLSAAISDWRDREVSDIHWAILGISGLVLFLLYSVLETGFRIEYILLTIGTLLLMVDILWNGDFNPFVFYFIVAVLFIVSLFGNMSDPVMIAWASIPLCYLMFLGMYMFNIIRGGADVKCLITLSVMFPVYPVFFGFPLIDVPMDAASQIFVFSLSALFVAAVMVIPVLFYFIFRNLKNGKLTRKTLHGYWMNIEKAKQAKVWPIEDIEDGESVFINIPHDEDIPMIYERLEGEGRTDVWVTPMIPFLIPVLFSVLFLVIVGNPLFLIL